MTDQIQDTTQNSPSRRIVWLVPVLLAVILLAGAYFRFIGLDWDQNHHLHPDERFLTMVSTSVEPVSGLSAYFNTAESSLNPMNRGYSFFVYGTLPLFIARYAAEWVGQTGYDQVQLVGRALAALFDLGTVLLVFLITYTLYRKQRMALLAAAFFACAVLPIQASHFYTVENYLNFFTFLSFYFGARIMTEAPRRAEERRSVFTLQSTGALTDDPAAVPVRSSSLPEWLRADWKSVINYALFGLAVGMALACKVSAWPMTAVLPAAALVYYSRLNEEERKRQTLILLRNVIIAGAVAVIAFRIFQPYAFKGPGFFGVGLNPQWVNNMKEIAQQSGGDVDFPPALQWARRPITFAWTNLVDWGLGLPLGLLAWLGFLWMGWRLIKGEWRQHAILWGWTGLYFAYQSINFTRSMRYQILIYPSLAIIAAWAVFRLWDWRRKDQRPAAWAKIGAGVLGVGVLLATAAYAFAFTRIYTRPVTRVEASQWIYQNVPGPLNLQIETPDGVRNQPLAFRQGVTLEPGKRLALGFTAVTSGALSEVRFDHVVDPTAGPGQKSLVVRIKTAVDSNETLATGTLSGDFLSKGDMRGEAYQVPLDVPIPVKQGETYFVEISAGEPETTLAFHSGVALGVVTASGTVHQFLPEPVEALRQDRDSLVTFNPVTGGTLRKVTVPYMVDWERRSEPKTVELTIHAQGAETSPLASARIVDAFAAADDPRGKAFAFTLDQAVQLQEGQTYYVRLRLLDGSGAVAVYGSKQALESTWDDPLPLGLDNYNPYDFFTGVYRSDLNLEMYWDDNPDKLARFEDVLSQADYIFSSSNRQWGTTTRVPERYPLTATYYRALLGCPDDKEITWCYSVAEPGMFQGKLGFELVKVSQSDPNLGNLRFNSQFAEEAFTVYDAPKVMIFKKTADYSPERVQQILGAVDLSQVIHLTPRQVGSFPGNLLLTAEQQAVQRAGGTWSDLFNWDALQNRYPVVALILWYVFVMLLGWMVYPFVRLALGGLADRGYPFARLVGFLLFAWLAWLAGSAGVHVTRLTLVAVLGVLLIGNGLLFALQRDSILAELRERRRTLLATELLLLAFFIFDLLIRLGNPDLWHPYKGGEKPMDFSYFNAVIKSDIFPPYDPWFAGGYINYYYYGFVLAGMPVKLLGIVPSIAYNLILPTFFSFLGVGAFSVVYNLIAFWKRQNITAETENHPTLLGLERSPALGGLAGSVGLLILGNLGSVRMIWHGLQRLAAPDGNIDHATIFTRLGWTITGLVRMISGAKMPYPTGDWYWIPSRVYPNEPITEFPFFTFLYADPHAHMFALPVTVLAVGWALSILMGGWKWQREDRAPGWLGFVCSFMLGGLAIGALRPTNTWDFYTFLVIGLVAVLYTGLRHARAESLPWPGVSPWLRRLLLTGLAAGLLTGFALAFYQPFANWYGQGYTQVRLWDGDRSPFWSYITHWGLFLFVILSWMAWETRDWLATTPVSALNQLRPYRNLIYAILGLLAVMVLGLLLMGVQIAWLALPAAAWALVLILRPGQPDAKRAVLFLIGSALFLTLVVETVVLVGDIGRMNTVFKFYLQAWTMFAISAGAALIWLLPALWKNSSGRWSQAWRTALWVLVACAALFPLLGGWDKIRDRMSPTAPHTLDGMAYMQSSTYADFDQTMDLSQDYRAIRWMQANIKGSPVIVEANTPEYRWGTRFTIYTGLPGVVGWNWHQRQQRALTPSEWVTDRVEAIAQFYTTIDQKETENFLRKYQVKFIVVGQLEHGAYPGPGLQKFDAWNGNLWQEVYRDADTVIYSVMIN